jgi:hypothetical protein
MTDGRYAVPLAVAALFVLFLVWGALHDISHANETDYSLEYAVLILSVPALALIHREAARFLPPGVKVAWLAATLGVLVLFDMAALSARLHPKYGNDYAVGSTFLAVTLPLLVLLCYCLVRAIQTRKGTNRRVAFM